MALYAVGDLQGCLQAFEALLERINFDKNSDHLWLTGDLVNRGPSSYETLCLVRDLSDSIDCVLGNHDISFLRICSGSGRPPADGSLDKLLKSRECGELYEWVRHLPLVHHDMQRKFLLVHAGLVPQWSIRDAIVLAGEVEDRLRGPDHVAFLDSLFCRGALQWREDLRGPERLCFIANTLTRIRFCDEDGRLALHENGPPGSQPAGYFPWFDLDSRREDGWRVLFGHWSALGLMVRKDVLGLDSGCVWGRQLTACRLSPLPVQTYSVQCCPPVPSRFGKTIAAAH